ncbi:MAG: hypothetical protein K6B41_08775 [Butyrivibrio sp.]|nr:hypothetical protein [Butyrivibrio sp.]
MKITEIIEDNLNQFENLIDPDMLENIHRKYYYGIAAYEDDEFVGAIIWNLKYVDDIYRNTESYICLFSAISKDVGEQLLDSYFEKIRDDDVEKNSIEIKKTNDGIAEEVLSEKGFSLKDGECSDLIVTIEQLSLLPIFKKNSYPNNIHSINELSERAFRRGIVDCMFHIQRDMEEDLDELSLGWYDVDISCYEETDGEVGGYMLVRRLSSGMLKVMLLADWGPDAQKYLLNMIRYSVKAGIDKYPLDNRIVIHRHDDSTYNLTKYLFGNIKGEPCLLGEKEE